MTTTIGINGFGRTGRQVFRAVTQDHGRELEIVAINDVTDAATNAHLLQYDSTYGRFPGELKDESSAIVIDGRRVAVTTEADPAHIPWRALGAEIVIESTGRFTDATRAK